MALGFGFGRQFRELLFASTIAQGKLKMESGFFLLQEDGRYLLLE